MTPFPIASSREAVPVPAGASLPPLTPDPSVEALLAQTNIYCYSVDYWSGRFRYVSPGISHLLGYDAKVWQFGGPQRAFQRVHPDDQECLRRIFAEMREQLMRYPVDQRATLNFAYTCRVQDASGEYLHLNHQLTFPRLDKQGFPVADFTVVTDISGLESPHPCMLLVRRVTDGRTETLHTRVFACAESVAFSRREIEVLKLVAEGCKSEEIGKRLFISYNTVCTHRKNLMKKAGVNGTVELLRIARGLGLIR
ncbi:regulatory LuxR family protein [Neolewinella xylanilytica]|uniref:Regulatory LuxR family protein n=1 Tax=Neolewinella xylanilytica TaxID=1514080 RepID=A0A2S6I1J0_9BACT|nr:LuxR C-terminal-related transcriptional regulator [Neolewinella xylanilytica]PPK85034.1 regulatory LuxR family protein [Neolewinella xylanilytica]